MTIGGQIRLGLCSVTLRQLPIDDVVATAQVARLGAIEWGGDEHVPPGDHRAAHRARMLCADAGIACPSYGSYFRAGVHDDADFAVVLQTAVDLGARRVRVWAGNVGSAAADGAQRARVATSLRRAARRARDSGVTVGLEYHGDTLTDTLRSTLDLLDEVDEQALRTYWQPPQDRPDDLALGELAALGGRVCAVHVFSWWPGATRLRLAERADLWRGAVRLLADVAPIDALLEFVPGDDPALLALEAEEWRRLVRTAPDSRTGGCSPS